ncbi:hypothetical protein PENSPDRAFT_747325 [Peniophora sp. CONT]|nr:hypothetical protein PENSPDRAFT_747325 [Peniophora sp. CONT]
MSCIYALKRKGGFKGINRALAIVMAIQWILCTGNFLSMCLQLIRGFVHPPALPSDPLSAAWPSTVPPNASAADAYFQNQSSPEHASEIAFTIFASLVADCFMTWRIYVVYDHRMLLAAPFLLLNFLSIVVGALLVKADTQVGHNLSLFYAGSVLQYALTLWATSVATQTAGTLLIIYRELSTPMYVSSTKMRRYCTLGSIVCAVIDSGATYTLGVILTLAFYTCKRSEGAIMSAILGQIATTVPLTIILREWWKITEPVSRQGPLLPRSALIRESYELQHQETLYLDTERPQETEGVNICVVKSTHMDCHSIKLA